IGGGIGRVHPGVGGLEVVPADRGRAEGARGQRILGRVGGARAVDAGERGENRDRKGEREGETHGGRAWGRGARESSREAACYRAGAGSGWTGASRAVKCRRTGAS